MPNNRFLGIKTELKKISADIENEEAIKNDIDYHKPKIEVYFISITVW